MSELSSWLQSAIKNFCSNSPENRLHMGTGEKAWGEPLVGFSSGADPLYRQIESDIGEFYMSPLEIFTRTFPEIGVSKDQLSVISWVIPQTPATKTDHRKETDLPSERWAKSRYYGEMFNVSLRKHVVQVLTKAGYEAVAPMLSPFWKWGDLRSKKYGISSNWSERHAAHISGLGTFGLCDGLITPVGKAVRCGSVVARISLPPSPRPYTTHQEYCLFHSDGTCGKCIKRCPAGALSEKGHDKDKCSDYLKKVTSKYVQERYGIESYACGLCQVGVPCESGVPKTGKIIAEAV